MLCRTAIAVLGITRNNAGRTALSAVIHSASCASETPAATETTDCPVGIDLPSDFTDQRFGKPRLDGQHYDRGIPHGRSVVGRRPHTRALCAQTFERRLGTCRTNDLFGLELSAANQPAGNGAAHVACAQNSDLHFQFVLKNNGSSKQR